MEETIDYQKIVEVLQAENEVLRERIAKTKLTFLNPAILLAVFKHIFSHTYFQIGLIVGCIITVIGGYLWDR